MTAQELLNAARDAGLELRAAGQVLKVRPADRLTPELRAALQARKPELLQLLAPAPQPLVYLRGGLTVPLPAFRLALDFEARGIPLTVDADQQLVVPSLAALTEADQAAIAQWRHHLAALVNYKASTC